MTIICLSLWPCLIPRSDDPTNTLGAGLCPLTASSESIRSAFSTVSELSSTARAALSFPRRTSASSTVGNLKLEPPGATNHPVSDFLVACLVVLGFYCTANRHALEAPHFYQRAALQRTFQLKRLALGRRDALDRGAHTPATKIGALPTMEHPGMLVVGGLVAEDRLGPSGGIDYPIQRERDAASCLLLAHLNDGNTPHRDLEVEDERFADRFGR